MKLAGRIALVTGAGTGIGRAIAVLFAKEGARVAVNYSRSESQAEAVAQEIQSVDGDAFAIQADVAKEADIKRMTGAVIERWGRLDVLVNNAGWSTIIPHRDLDALTDEVWDRTLDVNLRGAFYAMRAAAPHLRQNGGSIINVASAAAFHASGSSIIYAASKAALVNMTKSMARALAPEVRVNALCPGLLRTGFAGWTEEAFQAASQVTPIGRLVTPEEVADVALFLANATAITGESIICDGGIYQLGRSR